MYSMVHEEWLNEGDQVICDVSFKYFKDLISFKEAHKKEWIKWRKQNLKFKGDER